MSSNKKHRRKKKKPKRALTAKEIAADKAMENEFNKAIALKLLALVGAWILVLFSFVLTEETFVPVKAVLLLIAISGLITILPVILLRRSNNKKIWSRSLIRYFLIGGAISYFLCSAINYYGPHEPSKTIQLRILEKGSTWMKHSKKRRPYAEVAYQNSQLRIYFESSLSPLDPRAKMVELQIEKGALGYYIYTDKKLVP